MRFGMTIGWAALLASCGEGTQKKASPLPPEVRFATVASSSAPATIEAVGTIGLRRETSLGFTSAGRIAAVRVSDGDTVRRGQLLAALDTTTVAADSSAARAERDRAAAEYARSAKLFADGWITRPRLETAKATLAAADARVRASGFQSATAAIYAPGPGRILARQGEPGQVVAAGTPVLILGEDSGGYVLRVPLTDRDAGKLTLGAPASVTVPALNAAAVAGQIIELSGRADRATGTFVAQVSLPADVRLRAGQIGRAVITGRGTVSGLAVPPAAIFAPRAGEAFVYVLDQAKRRVALRKVTIAEASDATIQVTGGLSAGELVATSRVDRLQNGMAVRAIRIAQ